MAEKTPGRTELTVLTADDPNSPELNFTLTERQGTEIFRFVAEDHPDHLDPAKLVPVTRRDGLVAGDRVLVPSVTGGYHLMTIEAHPDGGMSATSEGWLALLEFGKDDRNAWACVGIINKRGLLKLRITT